MNNFCTITKALKQEQPVVDHPGRGDRSLGSEGGESGNVRSHPHPHHHHHHRHPQFLILIFILILIDTKLEGQSSDLANCISSACKQLDRVPAPSPICRLEETFPIFVFVFVLLSLTLCLLLSPILMTTSSTNRKTCDFSYMQRHTGLFFD